MNKKVRTHVSALVSIIMIVITSLSISTISISALAAPTEPPSSKSTTEPKTTSNPSTESSVENTDNGNNDTGDKKSEDSKKESDSQLKKSTNPRIGSDGKPILAERECAILVDAKKGDVFFEQNAQNQVSPASTTKIMTALLALEAIERGELNLNAAFVVTPDMLEDLDPDGSSMRLLEGEIITVQQLLEGLLVESGNDAGQAISIIVCGDVPTFVERMNHKAEELQMTGTNFSNPHGLDSEDHYTTAEDLSKLARVAMKNKMFKDIVAMKRVTIPETNMSKARSFLNTNGLISTLKYVDYFYPNATGVKTGHTSKAGYCLVSSAVIGNLEVVAVVMNAETEADRHYDSRNLLSYALDNFKAVNAIKKDDMVSEVKVKFGLGSDHTTLSVEENLVVNAPKDVEVGNLEIRPVLPNYVSAPVAVGDKIGTVEVVLDGKVIGTGDLLADTAVKRHPLGFIMEFFSYIWGFTVIRIILIALMIAAVILIIYMFITIRKNIKLAKRRARSRARTKKRRISDKNK